MHNKKCKKVLAAVLAGTMVLGMGMTAFAEDPAGTGSTTGDGEFEGHVEKNVLEVALPTVATGDKTFAYTMDPEGLIAATEGAKDKTASFEDGATVYFQSADKTYTKNSAKLKAVNKGTVDADVTVTAETATNNDIAMASSSTFEADNKNAELYLGLQVANQTEVAVKASGDSTPASVSVGLKGVADNYQVKYDEATKKYSYAKKDGLPDTAWNSFEFGLTGACNPKGSYAAENLAAPDVTVTWSYVKRADNSGADMLDENKTMDAAPSVVTTTADLTSGQPLEISVNLGAGSKKATGISGITFVNTSLGTTNTVADSKYSYADGKITFIADWVTAQITAIGSGNTRTYTVTFDDSASTTGTFTVTAP